MNNPLSHLLEDELDRLLGNVRANPALYTVKEADVERELHIRRNPVLPPVGWIPVSEKLPEVKVPVLCWRKIEDEKGMPQINTFVAFRTVYRRTQTRWFLTATTLDSDGVDDELAGPEPTHWLPIPGNLPVFNRARLVRWMRDKVVWCRETVAKGLPEAQAKAAIEGANEIDAQLHILCAERGDFARLT